MLDWYQLLNIPYWSYQYWGDIFFILSRYWYKLSINLILPQCPYHINTNMFFCLVGREDEIHTPKMGTWESSRTPETSEFDYRGQNTLHWGLFYIIRKLSKCSCRKWVRMGHLDICSTCYGKKKGRESNC
jgi:hypothetical protein